MLQGTPSTTIMIMMIINNNEGKYDTVVFVCQIYFLSSFGNSIQFFNELFYPAKFSVHVPQSLE
jgi:hypothetical protein